MNYILIFIEMILTIFFIIFFYKKEGYEGIKLFIVIAYVLSILISIKNIEILTFELPLGIILTTSLYLASNILVQDKGLDSIKQITKVLTMVAITIISIITLTASMETTNTIVNTYNLMFVSKIRTVIATAIIPLLILNINSIVYYQLKREKNNIIVNSILTSIIILFIDATLLGFLTYIFVIPISNIFITIAIMYLIKIIMGIITIPTLYITKKNNKN